MRCKPPALAFVYVVPLTPSLLTWVQMSSCFIQRMRVPGDHLWLNTRSQGLTTNQTLPTFWPVVSPGLVSLAQKYSG